MGGGAACSSDLTELTELKRIRKQVVTDLRGLTKVQNKAFKTLWNDGKPGLERDVRAIEILVSPNLENDIAVYAPIVGGGGFIEHWVSWQS